MKLGEIASFAPGAPKEGPDVPVEHYSGGLATAKETCPTYRL